LNVIASENWCRYNMVPAEGKKKRRKGRSERINE
jgi:hypothetical protein